MAGEPSDGPPGLWRRQVLYPDLYTWFVFVSALDVMMTWLVLYFGGSEVNLFADYIIERYGPGGVVLFKFSPVVFVIVICELVGRHRLDMGRRLASWAIAFPAAAVAFACVQLLVATR